MAATTHVLAQFGDVLMVSRTDEGRVLLEIDKGKAGQEEVVFFNPSEARALAVALIHQAELSPRTD